MPHLAASHTTSYANSRAKAGVAHGFMVIIALMFGVVLVAQASEKETSQFFAAVKSEDIPAVRKLIGEGVDVNIPEAPQGWSPLHYAAQIGSSVLVQMLLEAGANPNYFGKNPDQQGSTIFSTKPVVVAQAMLQLSYQIQANPLLHFQDADLDKRVHDDPKVVERYQAVIKSFQNWSPK